ncbi:MAG TPA: hydroxyisourate hydrolase [Thermohalobaculum sp.]|nr:hydroxyisourate hydrolase [Thermohalobaculum sp.]
MGRLTTHVLDTATGRPAQGVRIELHRLEGDAWVPLAEVVTNHDGRCDGPILEGGAFAAGIYELTFHVGAYFDASGLDLPELKFLDTVPIRFGIAEPGQHYHVPLLISPFSFSTYRGS